jgi:hypothetical protein
MIGYSAPADGSPAASLAVLMIIPVSIRPWRPAALLLARAGQLIAPSVPVSADPVCGVPCCRPPVLSGLWREEGISR